MEWLTGADDPHPDESCSWKEWIPWSAMLKSFRGLFVTLQRSKSVSLPWPEGIPANRGRSEVNAIFWHEAERLLLSWEGTTLDFELVRQFLKFTLHCFVFWKRKKKWPSFWRIYEFEIGNLTERLWI